MSLFGSASGERVSNADGTVMVTAKQRMEPVTMGRPVTSIRKQIVGDPRPLPRQTEESEEVVVAVADDVVVTPAKATNILWGSVIMMLFCILIPIVVITMLWVVDLSTNQLAGTILLGVQILMQIIIVFLIWRLAPDGIDV